MNFEKYILQTSLQHSNRITYKTKVFFAVLLPPVPVCKPFIYKLLVQILQINITAIRPNYYKS